MQTSTHNMMMYLSTIVEDAPGKLVYMAAFWTYQFRSLEVGENEKGLASKGQCLRMILFHDIMTYNKVLKLYKNQKIPAIPI